RGSSGRPLLLLDRPSEAVAALGALVVLQRSARLRGGFHQHALGAAFGALHLPPRGFFELGGALPERRMTASASTPHAAVSARIARISSSAVASCITSPIMIRIVIVVNGAQGDSRNFFRRIGPTE